MVAGRGTTVRGSCSSPGCGFAQKAKSWTLLLHVCITKFAYFVLIYDYVMISFCYNSILFLKTV